MRNIRVYIDQPLNADQSVSLGEDAHRHCHKVLRLRQGDEINLFNGDGCDYQAIINTCSKNQTTVFIKEKVKLINESPLRMILMLALLKGEAMDRSLQKSVELGATDVILFSSARSERQIHAERLEKKRAHWRGILSASAMQCGRAKLPVFHPICDFAEVINNHHALPADAHKWIFSPHHREEKSGDDLISPQTQKKGGSIAIVIGPEGGFTPEEVSQAQAQGFAAQSLGPRILRADTAAIAAMVRAQLLLGDF